MRQRLSSRAGRVVVVAAAVGLALLIAAAVSAVPTRGRAAEAIANQEDELDAEVRAHFFATTVEGFRETADGRGGHRFYRGAWGDGAISYNPEADYASPVYGSIGALWQRHGYERGLGYPVGGEQWLWIAGGRAARWQQFFKVVDGERRHATAYWHPVWGTHAAYGAINRSASDRGVPRDEEHDAVPQDGCAPGDRAQAFTGGTACSNPVTGVTWH